MAWSNLVIPARAHDEPGGRAGEKGRCLRVKLVVLACALMSLADLEMTLTYASSVGMAEINPLARAIMAHHSALMIILYKVATTSVALGILLGTRRHKYAEVASWVCFGVLLWLSVRWFNYSAHISELTPDLSRMACIDDPRWVVMSP